MELTTSELLQLLKQRVETYVESYYKYSPDNIREATSLIEEVLDVLKDKSFEEIFS